MLGLIPGIRSLLAGKRGKASAAAAAAGGGRDVGATAEAAAPHGKARTARTYAREAGALLLIASAFYCGLALASFAGDPLRPGVTGSNWVGPVGEVFARVIVELVGVVGWLLPVELIAIARPLLFDRRMTLSLARVSGDVVITVVLAALAHIAFPDARAFGNMPLAGVVGDLFGDVCRGLFSTIGSFLIGLTIVGLILLERAAFSFIAATQRARQLADALRSRTGRGIGKVATAWAEARAAERARHEAERSAAEPIIASPEQADAIIAAFADDGSGIPSFTPPAVCVTPRSRPSSGARPSAGARVSLPSHSRPSSEPGPTPTPPPVQLVAADAVTPSPIMPVDASAPSSGVSEAATTPIVLADEPIAAAATDPTPASEAATPKRPRAAAKKEVPAEKGPTIVDTSKAAKTKKARALAASARDGFALPKTELLDPVVAEGGGHSPEQLKAVARQLEKTLADYGVDGSVQEIHPGPTVTLYEVSPAPGTKVSKVASLADDLALGLSRKVRIIAPIPGKARIGFEVPNDKRVPVNLRELIDSQEFMTLDAPLPCVFGRDIIGRPFFADMASMPHVIVAGATGAGKSVGLNVMLVSLLFRRTPEELRLLMIDPKVVELAPFDRIPHLLFPVVTDMKQAANALKWAVDEMERRYQLFADAGTRNIETYNLFVDKVRSGERAAPAPPAVTAITADGTTVDVPPAKDGSDVPLPSRLPYIVVVVDEFADLMMTQGKEVETAVARLAQKARAAGMHVIIATQRPSVDVITGMIKANFPTRIAFRVAQKVDSRTIIDEQGAEHLLGRGDMLVKLNGRSDVRRVQCPFVSEDEVQRVTDHLRAQGEPVYDESIVKSRDEEEGGEGGGSAESDPLYDAAVRIVGETQKCTVSWIQRKLGIGYNRAAKIVESMEKNGVIGPANGTRPREIYIAAH
jgi:S-DNA-T family DNA segregation ATPase FtsK/SpoIIIE